MVFSFAHYAHNAAVDDEHGAGAARGHAAIEGASVQHDATACGLADGVLFGMYGAHAMLGDGTVLMDGFAKQVPHIVAVRQSAWRPDVSGDQDLAVFHDDTSATAAVAGGTLGYGVGKIQEIIIP